MTEEHICEPCAQKNLLALPDNAVVLARYLACDECGKEGIVTARRRYKPIADRPPSPEHTATVSGDVCRELLHAFAVDCNSIGADVAATRLVRAMKAAAHEAQNTPL